MPLEDPDTIDMAATGADGRLELVITDAGLIRDADRRRALLHQKLITYASYVIGERFREEHPGADPAKVRIRVSSPVPPTAETESVRHVTAEGNGKSVRLPVRFEVFK